MNASLWEGLGGFAAFATFLSIFLGALAGFVGKYVIIPKLNAHTEEKLQPIIETIDFIKKQVGENHHSNEQPTVLDRIDDVATLVGEHIKVADSDRARLADVEAAMASLKAVS